MNKYVKGSSLLLYLLAILTFFILGLIYAGLTDAGKNQGLAGGAIVLGYGVVGSIIGVITSLFVVGYARDGLVGKLNKIIGALLGVGIAFIVIRAQVLRKSAKEETEIVTPSQQTTAPAVPKNQ